MRDELRVGSLGKQPSDGLLRAAYSVFSIRYSPFAIRPLLLSALVAGLASLPAGAETAPTGGTCAGAVAAIGEARAAHDLDALAKQVAEAEKPASGCDEKTIYCMGRSVALGYLEAASAAAATGAAPAAIDPILAKGRSFGAPWQVLAALGDVRLAEARAGKDQKIYSAASLAYQQALLDLAQPSGCEGAAEQGRPKLEAVEKLYRNMSTALLLAAPIEVATTRCAPCQWLFITGVAGYVPKTRPLPITFDPGKGDPTPEGHAAITALLECLKGEHYSRIVLSGHTDEVGAPAANVTLSAQRLGVVKKMLVDGGFTGEIVLEPKGSGDPYPVNAADYSVDEVRRLNRRVELHESTSAPKSCN